MGHRNIHNLRDQILFDQNLSHFDSRLLMVLLWHRNGKNYACFPAQKTLAMELNCSAEHVSKRLHVCRELGYVEWKKSNNGLDYWFPWLANTGPYERKADKPTLKRVKQKCFPHLNHSSSSNMHKTSSAVAPADEPEFKSHLASSSSSDMNSSSSSYISPEGTPEISPDSEPDLNCNYSDSNCFEQARPPRADALRPLSINRKRA